MELKKNTTIYYSKEPINNSKKGAYTVHLIDKFGRRIPKKMMIKNGIYILTKEPSSFDRINFKNYRFEEIVANNKKEQSNPITEYEEKKRKNKTIKKLLVSAGYGLDKNYDNALKFNVELDFSESNVCRYCSGEFQKHLITIFGYNNDKRIPKTIEVKYCPNCSKIFLFDLSEDEIDIILKNYKYNDNNLPQYIYKRKKEIDAEKEKYRIEHISEKQKKYLSNLEEEKRKKLEYLEYLKTLEKVEIKYNDFLIISSTSKHGDEHHITDIIGVINVLSKNKKIIEVETPAFYCRKCNKYYILEDSYDKIRLFGEPITKTIKYIDYKNGNFNFESLNEKSKLNMFGYNVNYIDELSEDARHNILANVVKTGLMSRNEISSFLKFLINTHTGDKNERARMKWYNDLNYIMKYNLDELLKYKVDRVKIYEKKD